MIGCRRLLLLLLCLTLPLYGLAAVAPMRACPVRAAGGGAAAHDMAAMTEVEHCAAMATAVVASDAGQPASGAAGMHDCRDCCHVYQPPVVSFSIRSPLRVSLAVVEEPVAPVPSDTPDGLWRPPRPL